MGDLIFIETVGDFLTATLLLGLSFAFSIYVGHSFKLSSRTSIVLLFWHTLFCIAYAVFTTTTEADAVYYFRDSLLGTSEFSIGSGFPVYFTSLFSYYLSFTYLNCFLVYNLFGLAGLLGFAGAIKQTVLDTGKQDRLLRALLPFLPGLSFWSGMVGKDSVSFGAAGLMCMSLTETGRWRVLAMISIGMMLLVRPHIALAMLAAHAIRELIALRARVTVQFATIGVLGVGFYFLAPFVLSYVGMDKDNKSLTLSEYVESRQAQNLDGGSSIFIAALPLYERLFVYVFRPLFFDAQGVFGFAASMENLVLLLLALVIPWSLPRFRSSLSFGSQMFVMAYVCVTWYLLADTTANLGIALRQKWMFVPMLLQYAFSLHVARGRKKAQKTETNSRISGRVPQPAYLDAHSAKVLASRSKPGSRRDTSSRV